MNTSKIKLSQIKINNENPRSITTDKFNKLVNSILVFPKMMGIRPIVIDNKMVAIGGNMRLQALKYIAKMSIDDITMRLSMLADFTKKSQGEQQKNIEYWYDWIKNSTIEVIFANELTEEERKQFVIKDNVSFGDFDWDKLANNYDEDELEDWGMDVWNTSGENGNNNLDGESDIENVEDDYSEEDAKNAESICKRGDIWQLGEHRLMCGDSTNVGDIALLMNNEKIDLVFTDPPYGNGTHGKYGRGQLGVRTIKGDENLDAFEKAIKNDSFDKIIYFLQWRTLKESFEIIENKSLKINTVGVWNKKVPGLNGAGGFGEQWEAIVFSGKLKYTKFGGNVFSISREFKKREDSPHPHQKPIQLLLEILSFIDDSQNIYDPFGGSGSTLIACEHSKRKCFTMELDEHYCDVIIDRWQKLTGEKAVKL